jgi:hypothetical protein
MCASQLLGVLVVCSKRKVGTTLPLDSDKL